MTLIFCRPAFLTALVLLSIATVRGGTTAQTDLASITVTPLTRQAGAKADWQTIYDYTGGAVLPPGTSIISEGKWIDPPVRKESSGVTFSFPDLPDQHEAAQQLRTGFAYTRPLSNYPTRVTIRYTSYFDQNVPGAEWSPFQIKNDIINYNVGTLFGRVKLAGDTKPVKGGAPAPTPDIPFKTVGDNTLAFSFGSATPGSITMNGQDATNFFIKKADQADKKLGARLGAMTLNALDFSNDVTQFPQNKGDWYAVHAFKIEQLRPPLEDSSEAAVDLNVPGSEPVHITVEIVDAQNDSRGYLLKDSDVFPGRYRLYWDGVDQGKLKSSDTAWIGAGSYSFRLTTSKTAVHDVGDIDNSVPKYNVESYHMLNCTALAVTPPGPPPQLDGRDKSSNIVNNTDTRKLDAIDSVQLIGVSYDGPGKKSVACLRRFHH